jgi:LmbE family N-acetylglucosaminyl deacetylase
MAAYGGPFDLTLDFGYRANPEHEPEVSVRVTMSWEHAVVMIRAMRTLVDSYEKQVRAKLPDLEHLRQEDAS